MNARLLAAALPLLLAAAPPDSARPPQERQVSGIYDLFYHSVVRPLTRAFDPALGVRRLSHNPREAANVDENDQVRLPSTWWQPRLGYRPVTLAQVMQGPGPGLGPVKPWTVTKAKNQGVTPGLQIKDAHGDKFLLKFDPLSNPEMSTAADVIGSYVFWAAGYNVPENTIATFRLEDLEIGKGAAYTDPKGKKRPMTRAFLEEMMQKVPRRRDGTWRAMASRFLPGKPLGPFDYSGRRKDDPEDLVPHELRRELRGLWAVAAWVNHADIRGPNSLDTWISAGDRSFVRHNLIDFGSILGSAAVTPRAYQTGTEYYVDAAVGVSSLVTFGLRPFDWERTVDPHIPAVGFIESDVFDPASWRPDYPNPAFDERTERDVRWGVQIVRSFKEPLIRAIVDQAHFSDPAAAEYLVQTLLERRNKLVRYWLGDPRSPDEVP